MSIDASTLPINPAFALTAIVVGAVFTFGIAPEITRREMARSDWQSTCAAEVQADIAATRRPETVIPQTPDVCGMLGRVYPELNGLCAFVPDPSAPAREAERRLQELENSRIARTLEGVSNRCTCAETVYIEEERLSLALYATTGRQIIPPSVKNRNAALSQALRSPTCRMEG